jgi:hypothetical protein
MRISQRCIHSFLKTETQKSKGNQNIEEQQKLRKEFTLKNVFVRFRFIYKRKNA